MSTVEKSETFGIIFKILDNVLSYFWQIWSLTQLNCVKVLILLITDFYQRLIRLFFLYTRLLSGLTYIYSHEEASNGWIKYPFYLNNMAKHEIFELKFSNSNNEIFMKNCKMTEIFENTSPSQKISISKNDHV